MASKGRPRKQGKRHVCGKLVQAAPEERADKGTAELRSQRRRAMGRDDLAADFPLEVARARQVLSDRQADAGWRFAGLYWACYGHPQGGSGVYRKLLSGVLGGGQQVVPGEMASPKQRAAFQEAHAALSKHGASVPRVVIALCCHFDASPLARDTLMMRHALDTLDALFSAGRGRSKRSRANNETVAA